MIYQKIQELQYVIQDLKQKISKKAELLANERTKKNYHEKMEKANLYPEKIKEANESYLEAQRIHEEYYRGLLEEMDNFTNNKMIMFEPIYNQMMECLGNFFTQISSSFGKGKNKKKKFFFFFLTDFFFYSKKNSKKNNNFKFSNLFV